MQYASDHETLDSYRVALEVARWISSVKFPTGTADLRDHGMRAARSVVLNIAEGRSRGGDGVRSLKAGRPAHEIYHGVRGGHGANPDLLTCPSKKGVES